MTKKDYELIAKVFNSRITSLHVLCNNGDVKDECGYTAIMELQILADKLATELKADNREFDTDKFLNQSGVLNNPFDPESSNYIA